MIKQVEGFNKYAGIVGFRDVHLGEIDHFVRQARKELSKVTVQFFDASLIAGWQHLFFAAVNGLNALEKGLSISRHLAVECLLYASAQGQINEAMRHIGVRRGSSQIAVLVIGNKESVLERSIEKISKLVVGIRDDRVLELTDEKTPHVKEFFGISEVELKTKLDGDKKRAVTELVIEHIALLATKR